LEETIQTSRETTIELMMTHISGCQRAASIMKMKVTKVMSAMQSPVPAGEDRTRQNSGGFTWEPVISTGMMPWMATMWIWMISKKHRKPMMDQRRMCRTQGKALQHVKIRQYISDLPNAIMVKSMQLQAMYLKQ
jgi:hypothetical protein